MHDVVYLTGAPAAGKSSLTRALKLAVPDLAVFEYGERLTAWLNRSGEANLRQTDLRAQSAGLILPADVQAVDRELIDFVRQRRQRGPVIVDSHAVTKETYGFRVIPFQTDQLRRFAPTQIWVLFADPQVTRERISADHGGRPLPSEEEARMHTVLQADVAVAYAVNLGLPIQFVATAPLDELTARLVGRLSTAA